MADITKEDIKEAVLEVIEPFAKSTQKEFVKNEDAHTEIRKALKTNEEAHDAIIKAGEKAHTEIKQEFDDMKHTSNKVLHNLDKFFRYFEKHDTEHSLLGVQMRRLEERIEKLEAEK